MYSNRTWHIRHVGEANPHTRYLTDVLTVYGPLFLQLHRRAVPSDPLLTVPERGPSSRNKSKIYCFSFYSEPYFRKNEQISRKVESNNILPPPPFSDGSNKFSSVLFSL